MLFAGSNPLVRLEYVLEGLLKGGFVRSFVVATLPESCGRPTPKARGTRAGLVEIAAEIFAREGFAAASLQQLGERVWLTTGSDLPGTSAARRICSRPQ